MPDGSPDPRPATVGIAYADDSNPPVFGESPTIRAGTIIYDDVVADDHKASDSGFDGPSDIVEQLEATGARVIITSERSIPEDIEDRRVNIPYSEMHNLQYYADMFVGESPAMSVESDALGTPAVFVATTVPSNTVEIEEKYGWSTRFPTRTGTTRASGRPLRSWRATMTGRTDGLGYSKTRET